MKPNRPAWHHECRRVSEALHGEVDFFEPKDGDESWSFAADGPESRLKRRAGHGRWRGHDLTQWRSWHRLDGKDEWEGLAYLRAYLARNGLALRLPHRRGVRRSPFLSWLTRSEIDRLKWRRWIRKEDTNLLWAALRVLCHKRAWPPGIPRKKIFPEDTLSPRERLLRQAEHTITASKPKTRWRRPLIRIMKYPKKGPNYAVLAA